MDIFSRKVLFSVAATLSALALITYLPIRGYNDTCTNIGINYETGVEKRYSYRYPLGKVLKFPALCGLSITRGKPLSHYLLADLAGIFWLVVVVQQVRARVKK